MAVLRVSAASSVPNVAGSIIKSIDKGEDVMLRAMGAGAVSQMYKSIARARGIVALRGKDLLIKPGFDNTEEDGEQKTIMVANLIVM